MFSEQDFPEGTYREVHHIHYLFLPLSEKSFAYIDVDVWCHRSEKVADTSAFLSCESMPARLIVNPRRVLNPRLPRTWVHHGQPKHGLGSFLTVVNSAVGQNEIIVRGYDAFHESLDIITSVHITGSPRDPIDWYLASDVWQFSEPKPIPGWDEYSREFLR